MQNDGNNQDPYKQTQPNNNQQQGYIPDADQHWYQYQAHSNLYKRPKPWSTQKKVGLGILIAIGALLYFGWSFYNFYKFTNAPKPWQNYSNSSINGFPQQVQSSMLTEASSVSLTISNAISQYQAMNGSLDLSGLDVPKGTIQKGFVSDSPLYEKLYLTYFELSSQANLDPEDFYMVFDTDGKDGSYKIICDASKSVREGKPSNGLEVGYFEYDPFTRTTTLN